MYVTPMREIPQDVQMNILIDLKLGSEELRDKPWEFADLLVRHGVSSETLADEVNGEFVDGLCVLLRMLKLYGVYSFVFSWISKWRNEGEDILLDVALHQLREELKES